MQILRRPSSSSLKGAEQGGVTGCDGASHPRPARLSLARAGWRGTPQPRPQRCPPASVRLGTPSAASRAKCLQAARVAQKSRFCELGTGPSPPAVLRPRKPPTAGQAGQTGEEDRQTGAGWASEASSTQRTAAASGLATHLPRERNCVCAVINWLQLSRSDYLNTQVRRFFFLSRQNRLCSAPGAARRKAQRLREGRVRRDRGSKASGMNDVPYSRESVSLQRGSSASEHRRLTLLPKTQ